LAGHRGRAVVGADHERVVGSREGRAGLARLGIRRADEVDLGSAGPDPGDLDGGCRSWDEDIRPYAGRSPDVRDGQPVVAPRRGDDALGRGRRGQYRREGTTGFERAGVLEQLELEGGRPARGILEVDDRRAPDPAVEKCGRRLDVGAGGHGSRHRSGPAPARHRCDDRPEHGQDDRQAADRDGEAAATDGHPRASSGGRGVVRDRSEEPEATTSSRGHSPATWSMLWAAPTATAAWSSDCIPSP